LSFLEVAPKIRVTRERKTELYTFATKLYDILITLPVHL